MAEPKPERSDPSTLLRAIVPDYNAPISARKALVLLLVALVWAGPNLCMMFLRIGPADWLMSWQERRFGGYLQTSTLVALMAGEVLALAIPLRIVDVGVRLVTGRTLRELLRGRRAGPVGAAPRTRAVAPGDARAELSLSLGEAFVGGEHDVGHEGRGFRVKVPAGILNGQRIRLPGAAGPGRDVMVTVRIRKHPHLERQGKDLFAALPLSASEAAAGTEVTLAFPDVLVGASMRVRVPPGVADGTKLRLRGRGMSDPSGGEPGDLDAVVQIGGRLR